MDARELIEKIRRLSPLQSVTLRFEKNGMAGLSRLFGLLKNNSNVRLANEHDNVVMLVIIQSRDWGNESNRSFTVYGLSTVEDGWLSEISIDVESLAVADHGAKALMSSREKMRQEATTQIIAAVLTRDFVNDIRSYGFDVDGQLIKWKDTPSVEFRLSLVNEGAFSSFVLDGWSGRMWAHGKFGDELYVRPEQLQKLIRDAAEAKLEELTAA